MTFGLQINSPLFNSSSHRSLIILSYTWLNRAQLYTILTLILTVTLNEQTLLTLINSTTGTGGILESQVWSINSVFSESFSDRWATMSIFIDTLAKELWKSVWLKYGGISGQMTARRGAWLSLFCLSRNATDCHLRMSPTFYCITPHLFYLSVPKIVRSSSVVDIEFVVSIHTAGWCTKNR